MITGSTYPDVILSFQPPGEITNEADCGLLAFSKPKDGPPKINISKNWSLPTNAERILDLAFGQSVVGKGVFVLYEVSHNYASGAEDDMDEFLTLIFRYKENVGSYTAHTMALISMYSLCVRAVSQRSASSHMLVLKIDQTHLVWPLTPMAQEANFLGTHPCSLDRPRLHTTPLHSILARTGRGLLSRMTSP